MPRLFALNVSVQPGLILLMCIRTRRALVAIVDPVQGILFAEEDYGRTVKFKGMISVI